LGSFFGLTFQELLDSYKATGEIPAELQGMVSQFNYVLLAVVAVIAVVFVIYWLITTRYSAKKETKSI
jgi:hypothetical protein